MAIMIQIERVPIQLAGAVSSVAPLLTSFLYKVFFFSAIVFAIYLCGLSTYRLFLHPLRKYPGPILGSITRWYAAVFAARGVYHRQVLAWHHAYGPVVRIAPNTLSFNTHKSYIEIYAVGANNRKDDGYSALSASRSKQNLLSAQDKTIANHKRRCYSRIFSPQALQRVGDRVNGHVDTFISSLNVVQSPAAPECEQDATQGSWSTPVNLTEKCIWLTTDIVTDLTYSKSAEMQVSDQNRHFPALINFMTWRAIICVVQPQFYRLKLDRLLLASRMTQMKQLGMYALQRTQERLASLDDESDDLLGGMIAQGAGKLAAQSEYKDCFVETLLMLGAGVIASGPTLSSVFFFLVHTPDALGRLTHEIRSRFDTVDDIRSGPALNECSFLRACVDETQRMVPGVATILPRVVLPGGMVVEGEHIPEGTIVGSSNYVMHRNPDYFAEPDTFQPERWMTGDDLVPPESRRAFFPFGHGPRSCSGVHLALAELYMVVAKAVFVYDMRLAPDAPCCKSSPGGGRCTDREFKSYVGISTDGPMVQFRARGQDAG